MKRILALLTCVVACREPADAGPTSFEPVLSARELWSGGELLLTEPWFQTEAPSVVLGSDTLFPTRLNDTTFVLRLPQQTGTYPIRVMAGDQAASLGSVTLHGFEQARLGPYMSGQPYWLPGGGAPLVFAGANHGAAIVDLRTLTPVYSLPDSISSPDCTWTPSPSHRTDRFVLIGRRADGSCGFPKLWSLTQPPVALDSIACCGFEWYTSGQPSPGRWIFNQNNHNQFYVCDPACASTSFLSIDGPNGVLVSPRGDRFLWLPASDPVVRDARTLDTAWVIPGFRSLEGAFSFEGDTLAVTAHRDDGPGGHLLVLRADDGTVLRDIRLDSLTSDTARYFSVGTVAFDPIQPWLYVTTYTYSAADTAWNMSLVVLDRATWSLLGVLRTEARQNPYLYPATALVPSPVEHRVYLVSALNGYNTHGYPGTILEFSTP